MPKYARSPARRTRRKIVVATTLVATVLVGGALASNALQSDGGSPTAIADDTANTARFAGKTENRPEKGDRGHHKGHWHKAERPTPTPTPTPTPEETASSEPEPEPTETEEPAETQPPETEEPSTPEADGPFPTADTTGPRTSDLKPANGITTSENGQVIEGVEVPGIKVVNDDVTIRDVRIVFEDGKYGLHIAKKNDGSCPSNVVIEYVEVTGTSQLDDESIAVYSPCPYTLRNSSVHDVGSAVRITNGTVITGNYIHANHYISGSGAHRSAIGLNGGDDHTITGNTVDCEGPGCSGALVMYGDFSPVENVLIEGNLLNTTGSYCTYGGSVDSKKYPNASNVRYIDNHFGRKYSSDCGKYGPVTAWEGGNGNEWSGNVWADTGTPVGG